MNGSWASFRAAAEQGDPPDEWEIDAGERDAFRERIEVRRLALGGWFVHIPHPDYPDDPTRALELGELQHYPTEDDIDRLCAAYWEGVARRGRSES